MSIKQIFKVSAVSLSVFFNLAVVSGQNLKFHVLPGVSFPYFGSESKYSYGFDIKAGIDYPLPFFPVVHASGAVNYTTTERLIIKQSVNLVSFGLGGGVNASPFNWMNLNLTGLAGGYVSAWNSKYGASYYLALNAGASFTILPGFSIGLNAGYADYGSGAVPFIQSLKLNLSAVFVPVPGKARSKFDIPSLRFNPVFPVLLKSYEQESLGQAQVKNEESGAVSNVEVSFFIPQYMEKPKVCAEISRLATGELREIPLTALLKENVLALTESTIVSGTVSVSYDYENTHFTYEKTDSVRLYDRNALNWDDDRKAAAFINTKDPKVMKLSKIVSGSVRDDPARAANLNFRSALGLFESLNSFGIRYVVDPKSAYAVLSSQADTIDYLQFPRQTIDYRGGDCDDLSILYCSLLESIGIETAFITVPGHIYAAFALGMDDKEAKSFFSNQEDIIVADGVKWIPVEITMIKNGFLSAWQEGARQWREKKADAKLYPMRESWKKYEPVAIPGEEGDMPEIASEEYKRLFREEMDKYVSGEIAVREVKIKEDIRTTNADPASINKLGVLYSSFGSLDKAETQFRLALEKKEYVPALVNLGTVYLIRGMNEEAKRYFQRAINQEPANPVALINMAKVEYEYENYGAAKKLHQQVSLLRPEIGTKYAYLAERSEEKIRAGSRLSLELIEWEE